MPPVALQRTSLIDRERETEAKKGREKKRVEEREREKERERLPVLRLASQQHKLNPHLFAFSRVKKKKKMLWKPSGVTKEIEKETETFLRPRAAMVRVAYNIRRFGILTMCNKKAKKLYSVYKKAEKYLIMLYLVKNPQSAQR